MKRYLSAPFLFIFLFSNTVFSQQLNLANLEQTLATAIQKAYPASVRMWGYDTVKKVQTSAQFSGVVVTAEGHILTAAHATVPNQTYKLFFPDGKEYVAVALGRIAVTGTQNLPDAAMMKILGTGNWPYAEMGNSAATKPHEPCISIAYPETLNQPLPSIRFGYVVYTLDQWGFLRSTCKMEPGDSGGPLFDYTGKVIGIHSRINSPEDENFEVPVNTFKKYWNALNKAENYTQLPTETQPFDSTSEDNPIITYAALTNLSQSFAALKNSVGNTCIQLRSTVNEQACSILGTLLIPEGKKANKTRYILSKSSMVGNDPYAETGSGRKLKARVLLRNPENDLVLLEIKNRDLSGITISALQNTPVAIGGFLYSVIPGKNGEASIAGSQPFSLVRKFSTGFFGANATFRNSKIILTQILPKSPADSLLKLNDEITGINGIPISRPEHYGAELMKYGPYETITIQGIRNDKPYDVALKLTMRPSRGNHPAEHISGGKSIRLDGFETVIAHDATITAAECGSPVFDREGKFAGINIARFSRTAALIMPAGVLKLLVTQK